MSKANRITNILYSIASFIIAIILVISPEIGFKVIAIILGLNIALHGYNGIVTYFMLNRHMIAGQIALYQSVIELDLGIFMVVLVSQPRLIILFYLVTMLLINGIVDLLRIIELIRFKNKYWLWHLARSIVELSISVLCIIFYQNYQVSACLYALWLVNSATEKIFDTVKAGRPVYILQ